MVCSTDDAGIELSYSSTRAGTDISNNATVVRITEILQGTKMFAQLENEAQTETDSWGDNLLDMLHSFVVTYVLILLQ